MDDEFILCSLAAVSALLIAYHVLKRRRKLWQNVHYVFAHFLNVGLSWERQYTASSVPDDVAQAPNPYSFRNYTRMDLATYEHLFAFIESRITGFSRFRRPISAADKCAVTLWYLATGWLCRTLLIFNGLD